jgi:HEAT repeat protein
MRLERPRNLTTGCWGLTVGLVLTGCSAERRFEGRPLSYWQERIKSPNKADRWRAAVALGELPPTTSSVRLLAEATKDPDSSVRYHAVRALVTLGPAAAPAAEELRERLQDPTPQTRTLAERALRQIDNKAAEAPSDSAAR